MRQHSVDCDASFFIGVETLIQKVAKKAAVLRNPLSVDSLGRRDRFRIVFCVGSKIAKHCEGAACDDWVGDNINVFVELACLESAFQVDMSITRLQFPIDRAGELPLIARNCRAWRFAPVSHRQDISRIVWIRDGILDSADSSIAEMAEWNFLHRFREHQVAAQQAGDRLSVFLCDWRIEFQPIGGIPLPSKANEGESFAEEPRIARVMLGVPVAAVDDSQNGGVAAVRTLENHRTVAFGWVLGLNGDEVRGELDFAILYVHCVGEIDDAEIVFVRNRQRNIDATCDALVGAGITEGFAVGDVGARRDLDVRDLGR